MDKIQELEKRITDLEQAFKKNNFSNLFVFDTPVQFSRTNIYPKDETAVQTGSATVDLLSTGRITIKDSTGTKRYIPYF